MNTPVSVSVAEITSLDDLLAEWKPRYETAKTSYTKFDASITNAKNRAAEYFAQQQALTEGMRDPNNRTKAQLEDGSGNGPLSSVGGTSRCCPQVGR